MKKVLLCLLVSSILATSPAQPKGCGETLPPGSNTFCTTAQQNGCSCVGTPADCPNWSPPASLWGELQPVRIVENATSYTGNQRADTRYLQWTSVDIEGNYLLTSWWGGIRVYDLTDPTKPVNKTTIDGFGGGFPIWVPGASEIDQYVYSIDAPEGDPTIAAVGGISPVGFAVVDLTNVQSPIVRYQDGNTKDVNQVYATTILGRKYAFAGDQATGLYAYDMTATREKNYNRCSENRSVGEVNCPSVYLGKLGTEPAQYVHGVGKYVVRSSGLFQPRSVEIYDVSNPTNPVLKARDYIGTFTAGVAMWQDETSIFLAVRKQGTLEIHNVSCLVSDSCGNKLGSSTSVSVPPVPESDNWKSVTFSRSGNKPFLFLGFNDLCHTGEPISPNYEALFDVSDPLHPRNVNPTALGTFSFPDGTGTNVAREKNYWSWYYADTAWGPAFASPRMAKFSGQYLYRAALTYGDIHKFVSFVPTPPIAAISAPTVGYVTIPLSFMDNSTGAPTSRAWTFQDGVPNTSTAFSPTVTYNTAGQKNVTLTVTNSLGTSTAITTVPILTSPPPPPINLTAFSAQCSFGICSFVAGSPVSFTEEFTGNVKTFYYDWDGNGSFEQNSPSPVYVHTYPVAGGPYFPRMRIVDSLGNSAFLIAEQGLTVSPNSPPPVLCPNGVVDPGETCSSCPADVKCATGQTCSAGVCLNPPPPPPVTDSMLLENNRFKLEVSYVTPTKSGKGQAVKLTADSGYFWFFNSANIEITAKVLDGCALNSQHWVFLAGMTDVNTTLKVTDTKTGLSKMYINPAKTAFLPVQDTAAFPCTPTIGVNPK